jgi:glyoxylase-like metal-dependent hydrolase (beta-lactamase superfamily II)
MVSMVAQQSARVSGSTYEVAHDLACLPQSIVNVYFYGDEGADDRNWVLIDAGMPRSAAAIAKAAAERFGPGSRPAAIVLTHGHFDHVGGLPDLADEWDVPIYCHPLEMPYLIGWSSYPPPDPAVGGGMMAMMSRLYPRGPYDFGRRVRTLPVDGTVPWMPGWQWIHTPGHTAGHVSLFRESDRALIVGDTFVTTRQESLLAVLTQAQQVWRPPAYYTQDWEAARRSIETLARIRPDIAATGHGRPMYGKTLRQQLADLLENWEDEIPHYGRYVKSPVVADERGVEYVPPPVLDRYSLAAVGIGIAVVAGCLLGWKAAERSRQHRRRRSYWLSRR